ncbi:hypothetical protein Tco_1382895, partial [Tanacetum coccineum]
MGKDGRETIIVNHKCEIDLVCIENGGSDDVVVHQLVEYVRDVGNGNVVVLKVLVCEGPGVGCLNFPHPGP